MHVEGEKRNLLMAENSDPYDDREREGDPYRELIVAIIERALLDASCTTRAMVGESYDHMRARDIQLEAIDWLHSNAEKPWSFRWICEQLDMSPDVILEATKSPEFQEKMGGFYRANRQKTIYSVLKFWRFYCF